MNIFQKSLFALLFFILKSINITNAQLVADSKFGKNRVQFDKFDWQIKEAEKFSFLYYDSLNTNYINQILNICEQELEKIETEFDFQIPQHFNFVFYYTYEHYMQSNAGLQLDWYYNNKITRVVNNKIILYYTFNTEEIRKQIKQGLVRIILEYILMDEEKGEINQEEVIDEFPKWFIYGLISYKAENWNTEIDYNLKVIVQENQYKNFKQFIKSDPTFAGQTFWYFVELKYGTSIIEKLINTLRYEKNLQRIFLSTFKIKYKVVLGLIFTFFEEHYKKDNVKRNDNPKGTKFTTTNFTKENIITIQANPQLKKGIYGIVEFKDGIYKVFVSSSKTKRKIILKTGITLFNSTLNQNYPLIAWQQGGLKLGVIYFDKTFLHYFEYDIIENTIKNEINLSQYFVSIQDFKYFERDQKILLSAIKNGQSDIFIFDLNTLNIENITNDIYDDIDPAYVTFLGKIGIIFASNRPENYNIDTINKKMYSNLTKEKFKIFLADYSNSKVYHFISNLTKNSLGDDRYPSQFTNSTFTYLSDKNGIKNRYISTFNSKPNGIDTLYYIDNNIYFNLENYEKDSILNVLKKNKIDKVEYVRKTKDSATSYAYTNYSRNIIESKNVSGVNNLVTDLKYNKYSKTLFKSNIIADENLELKKTNLISTFFIQSKQFKPTFITLNETKTKIFNNKSYLDSFNYYRNYFLSEFQFNPLAYLDTQSINPTLPLKEQTKQEDGMIKILETNKNIIALNYKYKFYILDFGIDILSNELIGQKYQTYTNGQGPINLSQQNIFNTMLKFNAYDILEDLNITLGYRFPFNFNYPTSDFIADIKYLKYRLDFGFTYYRNSILNAQNDKVISNYYSLNLSYPFNILSRLQLNIAARRDYFNYKYSILVDPKNNYNDSIAWNGILRLEYIYDNTIKPAVNISKGLKYKIYTEFMTNITKNNISTIPNTDVFSLNRNTFNTGFDLRYYKEIYKNFILATRLAADMSFGNNLLIYYLGGTDGWLIPTFGQNNPDKTINYVYQTLALNLRGYKQNAANGTKNITFNSELRFPIFATLINRPISMSFIRNLQLITFFDMGIATNTITEIKPNTQTFSNSNISLEITTSKYPFVAGYGYGIRSLIGSYFIRFDIAYPTTSFFKNNIMYLSLGLDF